MSEYGRLQSLVSSRTESGKIDEAAQQLLISYVSELTRVILDQSFLLSKLRQSNKIEASDIAFILEKKLEIVVPKLSDKHQFYKSIYKLQNSNNHNNEGERKGTKRKLGA